MRKRLWIIWFIICAILPIWLCATRMDLIRDVIALFTLVAVAAPIVLILLAFIMETIINSYK